MPLISQQPAIGGFLSQYIQGVCTTRLASHWWFFYYIFVRFSLVVRRFFPAFYLPYLHISPSDVRFEPGTLLALELYTVCGPTHEPYVYMGSTVNSMAELVPLDLILGLLKF